MLSGYFIEILILIPALSLINTAVLPFATEIITKRLPPFKTSFWISAGSFLVLFLIQLIFGLILLNRASTNKSILTITSSDEFPASPILNLLPLVAGFICCWLFNSTNIPDAQGKIIGYRKGIPVTLIQFAFLFLIGFSLIEIVMFLLR